MPDLEAYLRALYEKLPVGAFAMAADGHMLFANDGFRQLSGADSIEGWLATLDPAEQQATRLAWEDCRLRGVPFRRELASRRPDGSTQWLRWRALSLADGTVAGTLSDVTDLEEARAEAAAASRAKSQFLANMSHEIRTPLNSIVGMADLLWDSDLSALQRKYVGVVREAGDHLLALISDLLDLSRIDAGELGLERQELNLREQMDRAVDLVAERARKKGVEVHCRVAPPVPQEVIGDAVRLRQVLVNLLTNAVKFTERGEIVAAVEPAGGKLRFSVRDTGAGIAAADLERIFHPFEQAGGGAGGVGLGLSISRRLVEKMGGRMWVESAPGRGSTFFFEVELPAAPHRPGLFPVKLRGLRILIADEGAASRLILHEMLVGWGALVEDCDNLSQAVERATGFDALVLVCPLADGDCELVRHLRERDRARVMIVIVPELRAGDDQKAREMSVPLLIKPVRRRELLDAFNGALSGAERKPPSTPPLSILVADDSEDGRLLARAFLEGHHVDLVADGRAAVERALAQRYDVILMDLEMPVLDGLTAIREIRKRSQTPIIAVTAHTSAADALEAGANAHLAKPLKLPALLAALDEVTHARERVRVEVTPTVAALVPGFLANRDKDVRAARAALKRRDYHGLWVLAHTMKGLGASYGFDGITDIGMRLEQAAQTQDESGVARAVDELESYLVRVDYAVAS